MLRLRTGPGWTNDAPVVVEGFLGDMWAPVRYAQTVQDANAWVTKTYRGMDYRLEQIGFIGADGRVLWEAVEAVDAAPEPVEPDETDQDGEEEW